MTLSLLLFVFVMEAFNKMISGVVEEGGLLSSFRVREAPMESISISNLLFVDDTVFFCGAKIDQIRALRALLLRFEAAFGLKMNLAKSEVMSVGNVTNVGMLASILGCKFSQLPKKFLAFYWVLSLNL